MEKRGRGVGGSDVLENNQGKGARQFVCGLPHQVFSVWFRETQRLTNEIPLHSKVLGLYPSFLSLSTPLLYDVSISLPNNCFHH